MRSSAASFLLALAVLSAVATDSGGALAAKLTARERTRIEEPRPADVPDDTTLEAEGAVIGRIDVDIRNIFDESDPRENSGIYRLADRLHLRTRRSTIEAQLLFAVGDRYRAQRLAESERALRLLAYVYDAHVVPVRYANGRVDVAVITKDVWTLSPGVSFGRAGGSNATRFDLEDVNFLGRGKELKISRQRTVDRTSNTVSWKDPNVLDTRWTAAASADHSSDGRARAVEIARPFFSLAAPWSAKFTAVRFDRTVSRYDRGQVVDRFDDDQTSFELSGGVSTGLVGGWARRVSFGVRYDRNTFLATQGSASPAPLLPPGRTLAYPFVGIEVIEDRYGKAADRNEIGRTEDLYLGTEVRASIGASNSRSGAQRGAVVLAASALKGLELSPVQQLVLESTFSSRVEHGRARNLVADGGAKFFWRWREDWLWYAALSATVTASLDPELQLLLGGDNGLRGYPLRYDAGSTRALITVEQRYFTDWYPFRLARVGAAVFVDSGRTWGRGVVGGALPGMLSDLGLGLRLGNTRSGLGNVLHVDLAFPLDRTAGIKDVQFLVQTFKSF